MIWSDQHYTLHSQHAFNGFVVETSHFVGPAWRSRDPNCVTYRSFRLICHRCMVQQTSISTILLPDRFADFTGPNDAHFLIICLDAWKNLSNSVTPDSQSMSHRRNWMSPLDKASHNGVLSAAHNQVDLALLIAVAASHLEDFLLAIVMSMIGTRLDDTYSICLAVAIRLGAPVCTPHQCLCGPLSKVRGCMVSAVGNQAVGLPDIQLSMGSSKPPYRQLRFRQDSNHKVWFMAQQKTGWGFDNAVVDVWFGTLTAQTL